MISQSVFGMTEFLYNTQNSEILLFPKKFIVLINQEGCFCERLTNMLSCSAPFHVNLFPR